MKSIERKMIFRYIMIPVLVLTGCSFSNPFLSQFSDKGTLELLPVYTTDIDILSNTVSMVMLKDYVVWDRCHAMRGTVLHTYHIPGKILSQYKNVDGAHLLYKLNDSMVTSIQLARKCRMDILIRDTIKEVATYSFRIRNKDSFNWLDDYYFVSVYPTDETATYFFGQTTTKKTRYGVYEQSHQAFYPSTSCYPPTEKELTLLSPDYWNDAFIIKQKNRNRFAVFRKYYQLFDLIDVDRFTIKPVKRISIPHTLLTFQDQLNLERQLVFYFFPGLSIDSEKYIITLYQNNGQRYLLFWTWEGRPRYRYDFPKDYEIYGLCGDGENQIYALGVDSKNQYQLLYIRCDC